MIHYTMPEKWRPLNCLLLVLEKRNQHDQTIFLNCFLIKLALVRYEMIIVGYLSCLITHPLIFARFYWLLYVTWCKITGQLSRNNPRLRGYLSSDFFRRKETKPAGKSQLKGFTFSSLLFYMGEKQICFVKSSDNEIKKPVANAVPKSTKKSTKYAVKLRL